MFTDVYKEPLTLVFTGADREWLIGIVMRELEVKDPNNDTVTKEVYDGKFVPSFLDCYAVHL